MANGLKEKVDVRITVRFENDRELKILNWLDAIEGKYPPRSRFVPTFSMIARSCMVQFKSDFLRNTNILLLIKKRREEAGLFSNGNNDPRRDVYASKAFKEHFRLLVVRNGCDLDDYVVTATDLYFPFFVEAPWYVGIVYDLFCAENKVPDGVSTDSDYPKQTSIWGVCRGV